MKQDHIMSHDAIYVIFIAVFMTVLTLLGSTMAFQS